MRPVSDESRNEIKMTVPARPEFVHVLRLVACSVAARHEFPIDAINDVALAVDEAVALLLSARFEAATLTLRISPTPGHLEVAAFADFDAIDWPEPEAQESLTWKVVEGLTENARFERSEDGPGLIFEKRVASG